MWHVYATLRGDVYFQFYDTYVKFDTNGYDNRFRVFIVNGKVDFSTLEHIEFGAWTAVKIPFWIDDDFKKFVQKLLIIRNFQ